MLVGNDVVDIGDPDTDPQAVHPRFDGRVFRSVELEGIARFGASTPAGALERWRLWAAKEAAYKVARKLERETIFSPIAFEVTWLTPATLLGLGAARSAPLRGEVHHQGTACGVEVRCSDRFIHAIATHPQPPREVVSAVSALGSLKAGPPDASRSGRAVRELACGTIASQLGLASGALEIRREDRIPRLYLAGRRAPGDLSLSHHGQFVAFAYCLDRSPVRAPGKHGGWHPGIDDAADSSISWAPGEAGVGR